MTAAIEVRAARRLYGAKAAVDGASLALHPGRISCLLGPSGCGKSTLLRVIAGLEPLDGGEVLGDGRLLSGPGRHVPPEDRDVGVVFQDYALFPHLTVLDNVGFGLRRLPPAERRARAMVQLERVRMADRAGAYPQALSGGEQQRVALARALAREPRAILLDEPFSGLDGRLRTEVRDATLETLKTAGAAALIVTHDAEEAMMMGDDLALMQAGRILQNGTARDCYLNPASVAAAQLLGEVNVVPAWIEAGRATTALGAVACEGTGPGSLLVRPEGVRLADEGDSARVVRARFAGAFAMLTLEAGGQTVLCRGPADRSPEAGETVRVTLDPLFCVVLPGERAP